MVAASKLLILCVLLPGFIALDLISVQGGMVDQTPNLIAISSFESQERNRAGTVMRSKKAVP